MVKEAVKKTVKLYGGKVTIHFSSAARNRYVIEETGASPVGVTTILQTLNKPGLLTWPLYEGIEWLKKHDKDWEGAAKAYTIKSDKGKDVGTEVHAWVEVFLQEQVPITPSLEAQKACNAFLGWFEKTMPKVLATEFIIYSKIFDYAGTADALLEIDGKVVLCDVKTNKSSKTSPSGIYPEHLLQLGAYALAHHEENPQEKIDDLMVIRIGKDGVLNTLRASELGFKIDYLQDSFAQLVQVYRFLQPLTKQLKEMK